MALFESWRSQFSDNPRAISEELRRRGEPVEHVWVLDPASAGDLPDWVVPVAAGSLQHVALMGRARYLVANGTVLGFHRKRRGTTFLQTWHGTPLKRIGFHARRDTTTLARNVPNWDLLLAQNGFSAGVFREAFRYDGPILETGYPRNDVLLGPDAPAIRERARAQLGVRADQLVVLHAPTFRDDEPFALEDDAEALARGLGDGYAVLLRLHQLDGGQLRLGGNAGFRDVSGYPDSRELFLAADLLVTDYSSLMFDFGVTRKPMLFFTPDLERYRDELRGFYFDFEAEAPGPLLSTVDELVGAIEAVEQVTARYADRYSAFVERFCKLDDGQASVRAVDALLAAG